MCDFAYDTTFEPPAPICNITLTSVGGEQVHLTALIDTGADATLIPLRYLKTIGARRVFEMGLRSQWGERRSVFLYLVDVRLGSATLPGIYVVGDDLGDDVVLGRDVLNRLHLTLDGPAQHTQIQV